MKLRWALLIYNLLFPLALLVGLPRYFIKAIRRGGAGKNFAQRFGRYDKDLLDLLGREADERVWIHAVSVGEMLVALKLVKALLEKSPNQMIVLSTTTPTGFRLADKESPDAVCVVYNPVDLRWVVRGALKRIRPEHLILVEAEVWPNLVNQARRRGAKVSLVNARLSDRSERRFKRFRGFTRPVFRMLDCVCVQFEKDIQRWQGLGVEKNRIHETGSIKYDEGEQETPTQQIEEMRSVLSATGISADRPVLLAGSTHAGEEALIGKAYQVMRESIPELVYLVVPRHVERTPEIVKDLEEIGLQPGLRTECVSEAEQDDSQSPDMGTDKGRCLVVNTTGELRAWYHLSTVVVIGKSFLGKGGQNPVEAIMAGKPVVTGPHMENFRGVMNQLREAKGLIEVEGRESLAEKTVSLLNDPDEAGKMAERGRNAMNRHCGAAKRTVEAIS